MSTSVKVPKALSEKYFALTVLTDAFSKKHLNDEYLQLIHKAIGALARKRPSPLLKGKENVWAAGVIHAVGHVNFLDDPSQSPHCKSKTICEYFGIAMSTGQNKSKGIRDMLVMGPMSPEWSLPSQLIDNPMVWMLQVDGIVVDIRQAPIELQELAFEQGYIPFIPSKQQ
ncbi:MAG: hypothetical protein HOP23_09180 [Methylococcaceae bacterium]|nr:hypothetical protein [Methylococcaceae bacterium]